MALSIGMTARTTTSLTLRFTGLTGSSYTTMQLTVNGVTKSVSLSSSGYSTTATFTGLTAGTMYTATSKVVSSGGSTGTPYVGFYTLYNAVSSVSVGSISSSSATASWSHPSGGRSYRLALREGSTYTGTLVGTYYPTGTTQSFSGLKANTTYFVGIVNGYGQTETTSASTTFKTSASLPSTPTGVMANSSITSNSVYVSWNSASGATGYRIETYIGSTRQKSETTTSTGYTVSGLSPSTSYTFRVYATNSAGSSSSYDYNYATTNPTTAGTIYVNSISYNSAYSYWTKGSDVTSFTIEVRQGGILGTLVKSTTQTSQYYDITGLSESTSYTIKVKSHNSSTGRETGWITQSFTTIEKPVAPTAPTNLSATAVGTTGVKLTWTASSKATSYRVQIVSADFSSVPFDSNVGNVTTYTVSNLTAGRGYWISVHAVNSVGSNSAGTEITLLPTAMSGLTSSVSHNSMTVRWTANTGVDAMEYELRYNTSSGTLVSSGSVTGTSKTFTGLNYNTLYYFRIRGKSTSTNAYTSWVSVVDTTTPQAPTFTLTSNATTAGVVYVYFNTVSGATGYTATIYDGKTNAYVGTQSGTTSPLTFSGLKEFYPYGVYLKATNSTDGDSPQSSGSITTRDVTPPTLTITSAISEGVMQLVWTASDALSGLRSASRYAVSITAKGGTTYTHKAYTENLYYSFTTDANGDEFVDGGTYYMRVVAYDEHNNTTTRTSGQVTYKRARPNDWNWQNSKVKGKPWNTTAQEWNSLATRVNQFRQYKKLDNYAFTTVKVGDKMTATIYNQMRSAIASMTPPTALPSAVSKGTTILASHFIGLTNSLNSIK